MDRSNYYKYLIITAILALFVVIAMGISIDYNLLSGGDNNNNGNNNDTNRPGNNNNGNDNDNNDDDASVILSPGGNGNQGNNNRPGNNDNNNRPGNNNNNNRPGGNRPDNGGNFATGEISLVYTEAVNGITISNMMPVSDSVGRVLSNDNEMFNFTINSRLSGNARMEYEIAIIKDPSSTLSNDDVRLYLTRVVGSTEQTVNGPLRFTPISTPSGLGSPAGSMVMARVIDNTSTTTRYRLRMWVAEGTNIDEVLRTFNVRVNVYGRAVM